MDHANKAMAVARAFPPQAVSRPQKPTPPPSHSHIHCRAGRSGEAHSATEPSFRGPPPALRPGVTVGGRYVIVRSLGQGSMGQVFEAEHSELRRRFALKVVRRHPCTEETQRRFRREARALACVESPWVAQVTDFGHEEEIGLYYVMEYVQGETLDARLERQGRLPVAEAVELGIDLCAALRDVHEAGVIHRDVKPSNVALTRGFVPLKLLDFGLAVALDSASMERLTTSRTVVGSLAYLAPEVLRDERLTPSVDLYALGVLLFEAVTGRIPYDAKTAALFIHMCLNAPIPSMATMSRDTSVPPQLEAIVTRLLDKDPSQRFVSAEATARALRTLAS